MSVAEGTGWRALPKLGGHAATTALPPSTQSLLPAIPLFTEFTSFLTTYLAPYHAGLRGYGYGGGSGYGYPPAPAPVPVAPPTPVPAPTPAPAAAPRVINIAWALPGGNNPPFTDQTVAVGDQAVFSFQGLHGLFKIPNATCPGELAAGVGAAAWSEEALERCG